MIKKRNEFNPCAMSIAGSDSGGGAGIQADLRAFNFFGVFGSSAITAVTSQNPFRVARIDPLPPEAVETQIKTILEAFPVAAVKTGMLFNCNIIDTVARSLENFEGPIVVDPVMIATSGARLLEESAINALREKLLPLATWVTPNIPEAEFLLDISIKSPSDAASASLKISELYSCSCVLKGGHAADGDFVRDFLAVDGRVYRVSSPCLNADMMLTHGTGCSLSSAFAAGLAAAYEWQAAFIAAKSYVYGAINEYVQLNKNLKSMFIPHNSYVDKISFELY